LCAGRLLLVLEGGYDLTSLGDAVASACAALVGEQQCGGGGRAEESLALHEEPMDKVWEVLRRVRALHGLV
jgi:acetoin utilization deacetylase AcuC-like enzyme